MTPEAILAAIAADPALAALAAARRDRDLAEALSAGRTKLAPFEAGKGDVVGTLGIQAGNALCDAIDTMPDLRHVRHLLEAGRLRVDLPLTQAMLGNFVLAGIITAEHAAALTDLARVPDPVPLDAVSATLNGA